MTHMLRGMACIAVAIFATTANAAWERVSPDEIKLTGSIEKGSFEEYTTLAKDGYKTLTLASEGGVSAIALRIAEDVQARDVAVVIKGGCFSACANYLAIAGDSLTVECGAILSWHGSAFNSEPDRASMAAAGLPNELIEMNAKWVADFAARERAFFRRAGVDRRLLEDSTAIIAEEGIENTVSFTFDEETGSYTTTKSAAFWIPKPSVLEDYGIDTSGFKCPYGDEDIRAWFGKRGDTTTRFSSRGRRASSDEAK